MPLNVRRLPLSIAPLVLLAVIASLTTSPADAGRFERKLDRHERRVATWAANTTLSSAQLTHLLAALVRYPEPVREALLEAALRAADGGWSDVTATIAAKLPETLRPATAAAELLVAFPKLTLELAHILAADPDGVRDWLTEDARWRHEIDERARKRWIRLLRKNPSALQQLVDVSRAFQEEFARSRQKWEALQAAADAARQQLSAEKQKPKTPARQLVVVSDTQAWLYTQPPTRLDRTWGDPYNTWAYYEPAPLWRSLADRRDPLAAGIEQLEKQAVTVWTVPSYQVVRYVLSHTDLYPDLADALLRLAESGPVPESVRGAIEAWKAAVAMRLPDAEQILRADEGRGQRLRRLAPRLRATDVAPCRDQEDCTAAALLRPKPSLEPPTEIREPDVDQLALDQVRRARNIHATLWARIALERGD
ncbi:MAG: hypothetical protein D6761_12955 [Candidatus Dadabacteria bacterium]|nr:MAG: hypothetical protein D6761_12955 [Candidatus Dadabacteria bacterium]